MYSQDPPQCLIYMLMCAEVVIKAYINSVEHQEALSLTSGHTFKYTVHASLINVPCVIETHSRHVNMSILSVPAYSSDCESKTT